MNREKLIEIAKDTISRCDNEYKWMIDYAKNIYYDEASLDIPIIKEPSKPLNIIVIQQTTVEAIQLQPNKIYGVLNFASAKYPGGGVLNGCVAQEEALARASSLYPMLKQCENFYTYTKAPYYTDKIIYTKPVVVFKDDKGNIIPPIECEVITCAAPNYSTYNGIINANKHREIITKRFTKVLMSAIENNQRNLLLGAWGCGVFFNPPEINAQVFRDVLDKFADHFDAVIFAIPDDKNFKIFDNIL